MKNKKLSYWLLPVAALIWVLIIYKVISYNGPEQEFVAVTNELGTIKNANQTDTFSLLLNYPDPFKVQDLSSSISQGVNVKKTSPGKDKSILPPRNLLPIRINPVTIKNI